MKKSQWNEYEIVKLLQELPEVQDKRSLSEIHQKVAARSIRRNKQKKNWVPLLTAITALFLMVVLGSSLLGDRSQYKKSESNQTISMDKADEKQVNLSQDSGMEERTEDETSSHVNENNGEESDAQQVLEKEDTHTTTGDSVSQAGTLYSDIAAGRSAITIAVPDAQANYIIPVTVSVDQNDSITLAQVLVQEMDKLDEEGLGLLDFYPLDVTISDGENNNEIIIDFPEDSQFILLDAVFLASLQETLKYNKIEHVIFTTKGQPGVDFSHAGMLKDLSISKVDKKAFLMYQFSNSTDKFLVPSTISYDTITDALAAMKDDVGIEGIHPSVPETINWGSVREQNNTLEIDLLDDVVLVDSEETRLALDAILFTAKDFGFEQVQFFNAPVEMIQDLDLSEPIEIPAAPNKMK